MELIEVTVCNWGAKAIRHLTQLYVYFEQKRVISQRYEKVIGNMYIYGRANS
jgi:hypothetical protein